MEIFPNFMRQKSHKSMNTESPDQKEPKRPTARHIIIKMVKFQDKERTLKAAREKRK